MPLVPTMRRKLAQLGERFEEVSALLADPEVLADQARLAVLSREYAELEVIAERHKRLAQLEAEHRDSRALADESDGDLRLLAQEDAARLAAAILGEESALQTLLLPTDPDDGRGVFLEIRAGTGGDEAAIFCGDLFRMYSRYAEQQGWQVEILNDRPGERGGYREVVCQVSGKSVYARLKFESGAHRVQRVPETESQGRIHTSACTVAVLPEIDEIDDIEIDRNDLRIDTFRASGAGGQHVNKTNSAVRLTHLPTGIVVECQDERSQLRNRTRAMALLQARLLDAARSRQAAERAESRRNLVGSGDRSEKIRTYNFPQGRVTDHRINLTLYRLEDIIQGGLDALIKPLSQEHQADLLASLAEA